MMLLLPASFIYAADSTDVYGCMDSAALNYNPQATVDDGSCIYVNDTLGVTIICPDDVLILNPDPSENTFFVSVPPALASSEAGITGITNSYNDGGADASDYYAVNFTTTVTFTGTDNDGNTASCSMTVSIYFGEDSTGFTLLCPSGIYTTLDPTTGNSTFVYLETAIADGGVAPYSYVNDYNSGGADASDFYPLGVTGVNFTATDANGDVAECITFIEVVIASDSSDVYGCTDPAALNYNPYATAEDGSCIYANDSTECIASFQIVQIDSTGISNIIVSNTSTIAIGLDPSYFWDFGDGTTSTEPYPTHVYAEDGLYLVCLTVEGSSPNGIVCTDTYCDSIGLFGGPVLAASGFTLEVIPSVVTAIEENVRFISNLNVYPNPPVDALNIDFSLETEAVVNINIYDITGRLVKSKLSSGNQGINIEKIDVNELNSGMYVIDLIVNGQHNTLKFNKFRR